MIIEKRKVLTIYYCGEDNWKLKTEMHPYEVRQLLLSLLETIPDKCPKCLEAH